jgi:hypothetical protein
MEDYSAYGAMSLGDKTLSRRVEKTLNQLGSNPTASISGACQNPYQAKAIYRLLSNKKFTAEAVLETSQKETIAKIEKSGVGVVLLPQDTTTVNYTHLKDTEGLGDIDSNQKNSGMLMHSCIAVGEEGQIFGLLSETIWVRPKDEHGKKTKRKQLSIEEKESYKWLETIDKTQITKDLKNVQFIHVCDREGDIYELFAKASLEETTYLCRRVQNRSVINVKNETCLISSFLDTLPTAGKIVVNVPRDSHTKRKARQAELEVKFGKTSIKKPACLSKYQDIPLSVDVVLVWAREINPPDGVEAISWHLVTNDSVKTFEEAVRCIMRYTQRWKIETFHHVLKSGCAIEKLKSSTAEKLIKLISLYSIIALRIMLLTYLARTSPDKPCDEFFTVYEWHVLYKVSKKTKSVPKETPTIFEAVIMIAKLGGFLARKGDGFPGVTVMWRGITRFDSILEASHYWT